MSPFKINVAENLKNIHNTRVDSDFANARFGNEGIKRTIRGLQL